MASATQGLRNGQSTNTRSRFGDFMSSAPGPAPASSGINADIWGLNPKTTNNYGHSDQLQGSSSLEQSSVPENAFPRPGSSSAAAWASSGQSLPFTSGATGTLSPLRQRTAQNTRSSSPFAPQNGSSGATHRSRLNPETRNFDPAGGYPDVFSASGAASRASSTHRNANNGYNAATLSGYNSQTVSRNGSYPASRHGTEPSPTDMSFNMNEVNERLPGSQIFDSLDRPQSQGNGRQIWFGQVPADLHTNGLGGQSFPSLDTSSNFRNMRAGSVSSNTDYAFGSNQQADAYTNGNPNGSDAGLAAMDHLSLSVHLKGPHGLPVLTGNDTSRNGSISSNTQHRNPAYGLNQLRQNGAGARPSFNQQSRGSYAQGYQSSFSQVQEQMLRSQMASQAMQYGNFSSTQQFSNFSPAASTFQNGAQQMYYSQDGQMRGSYQQNLNPQINRGPTRSTRNNSRAEAAQAAPAAPTIKQHGSNWVLKEKPNGTTFIEASPDCRPKDIINHVSLFCGDQAGSRLVQDMIEHANAEDKEAIFREMLDNTIPLCLDAFGNYVIQKFFEYGLQRHKQEMANKMKGKIHDLSKHAYGCRCVQKAFEHILRAQRLELVEELRPCLREIAKDAQGNHVVQKVLQNMDPQDIQFILNGFEGQVFAMSNDSFACRVIQRLLEYGDEASKRKLTAEILRSADILMRNPYGNYVVQHVVVYGTLQDRVALVNLIEPQIPELVVNKFSSNVVERCLEHGTEEQRDRLVDKMLEPNPTTGEPKHLRDAMTSAYANYVVQRTLKTLAPGKWETFAELVRSQLVWMSQDRIHNKKCIEFERLLKQGPWQNGRPISENYQPQTSRITSTVDTNSQGSGTPPPLTRTQPSPQSSSAPSTNNSTVDGPTGGSVKSNSDSNRSGDTVVDKIAELEPTQERATMGI